MRIRTPIGGFAGSSTRTELAAAILAICSDGPIHIGSDSEAFVKKANLIIQMVAEQRKPKTKWQLSSDGDLWEHFHKTVEAKGHWAIKATWVKGHATEEHVTRGITTQIDRIGNNNADGAAD